MILVQNRRQQLNGSKYYLCLLLFLIFFSSCGIFKSVPTDTSQAPSTEEKEEVVVVIDTIDWIIEDETVFPPIGSRNTEMLGRFVKKSAYDLAVFLPFQLNRFSRITGRQEEILHFYLGMEHARERFDTANMFRLRPIDATRDLSFDQLYERNPWIENTDAFVGPYFSENLLDAVAFAQERNINLFSPFNSSVNALNNPYFIQLQPSIDKHARFINRFIATKYRSDQTLIIGQLDDRSREVVEIFQSSIVARDSLGELQPYPELFIDSISSPELITYLTELIALESIKAVIVPEWRDQRYVKALLSKLNFAKDINELEIFGLPQWKDYNRMDYDLYENNSVHISTAAPISYTTDENKSLDNYFRANYFIKASEEAYYGFEFMRWLINRMKVGGKYFQTLPALEAPPFKLDRIFLLEERFDEETGEKLQYYENTFLQMIYFEDYRFVSVNGFE